MKFRTIAKKLLISLIGLPALAVAELESLDEVNELATVEVHGGRGRSLLGVSGSASQGEVGQPQFEYRPMSRAGELVEVIPGALATQHSGSGKANQYFLRGFNLDHGTDFSVVVDGIPMNMATHAHGQGYLDLNSIIPELVHKVEYGKGPYYAETGDFSAAGYSKMTSKQKLDQGIIKFTGGEFGYYRGLLANSNQLGEGNLLYAGEVNVYDGVWQQPEDLGKFNGTLRYSLDRDDWGFSVNGKAYSASWNATNPIPQRAIDDGSVNLYGSIDPTDGGKSNRYSLASNFWQAGDNWRNDANLYALYYDVDLYSNFTGYLNDPVHGDQIHQGERRVQTGGNFDHKRQTTLWGLKMDNTIGIQFRHDEIMDLGLQHSQARQSLDWVSRYNVGESNVGLYLQNQTHWLEKFRTVAGFRTDLLNNDVQMFDNALHDANLSAANSGNKSKAVMSPKLSFIAGPWLDTEYFLNLGYGHHSNDARGTTLQFNPADGSTISPIKPTAWSRGAEVGIRSDAIAGLKSTLAFWYLESSQELVFVGDAGTTEVNGKSRRHGLEFTNYYKPTNWLTLDADLALTSAHYANEAVGNNWIPNSVGRVISTGATIEHPQGWFASLRLRHFGHVPLDQQGSFWAGDTNIVNFGTGYKQKNYKFEIDLFNLFGSNNSDLAYAYCSQMKGEANNSNCPDGGTGTFGLMRHPVEPRMVRGTVTVNF